MFSTVSYGSHFVILPEFAMTKREGEERAQQAARGFRERFGCAPAAVARVPGRVNLLGEHVDYEGYDVLPAALAHAVAVAVGVSYRSSSNGSTSIKVTIANSDAETYNAVEEVTLPIDDDAETSLLPRPETPRTAWTNYVLCGMLGILEHQKRAGGRTPELVKVLVHGEIPAGCGLSSSSALVVAAALAFAYAVDPRDVPSRAELAEICRRAEQRVGTMGGGMDQTAACLALEGAALHISFATQPPTATPVRIPVERLGVTFVVANSMVVAEKAVDAATRFNKRVVECALATKMISRKCDLKGWREVRAAAAAEDEEQAQLSSVSCVADEQVGTRAPSARESARTSGGCYRAA